MAWTSENVVVDMLELRTEVLALGEWTDARRPMVGLRHSLLMQSLAIVNLVSRTLYWLSSVLAKLCQVTITVDSRMSI